VFYIWSFFEHCNSVSVLCENTEQSFPEFTKRALGQSLSVPHFWVFPSLSVDESVFSAYRAALCSMVFSALSESNSSLQITATSVLTLLAQQAGERQLTLIFTASLV